MAESKHFLKYTPIYAEKNFVQFGKEIYNSYIFVGFATGAIPNRHWISSVFFFAI
jgi:hypothetical protein